MYCKEKVSLRRVDISDTSQCVVCEVTIQRQSLYCSGISRPLSQSSAEFDNFSQDLRSCLVILRILIHLLQSC